MNMIFLYIFILLFPLSTAPEVKHSRSINGSDTLFTHFIVSMQFLRSDRKFQRLLIGLESFAIGFSRFIEATSVTEAVLTVLEAFSFYGLKNWLLFIEINREPNRACMTRIKQ